MCTSVALNTNDFYFGRNLDLEMGYGQQVVITPRNFPFRFRREAAMERHYAMIGMATVIQNNPLYFEAVNEKGLGMAGLNFPDNAWYPPEEVEGKSNISPFELIWWLLGQCATVDEVRVLLDRTHVIGIPFSEQLPLSPLHWHIADREQSIVLECCRDGMRVHDNPVGVLTNNPPFDFHLQNLSQYMGLTALWPDNRFAPKADIEPTGRGLGAVGLPGDASPASRFIRAAFHKLNAVCDGDENSSVAQFFHILDAVAMTRGTVMVPDGRWEYTMYSCCVNADKGVYYYKTYENNQLTAVDMAHENLDGSSLSLFPLVAEQQIRHEN